MKYIIAANWKCYPQELKKVKEFIRGIERRIKKIKKVEIVIFPPFVYLPFFKGLKKKIKFGAQDVFYEKSGAFTGEISPTMLKDIGCSYVILGHSERRKYFFETDDLINKKVKSALKTGLIPIICIGESLKERDEKKTFKVLEHQLKKALGGIPRKRLENKNIVIAYEPVWAIGKKKPCSSDKIETVMLFIRKILFRLYGNKISERTKILYGGSVNSKNVKDILLKGRVGGFLIGSASLDIKEFSKILDIAERF